MSSKNYKYLFKNVGILAIGNFTTKLLNFFLVPLYTAVLSTTEYGEYDLLNTTIGLLVPIFTLNIFEGIFRYSLDKETKKEDLLRVAFKYFFVSFIPFVVVVLINDFFNFIPIFNSFLLFFALMFAFNALSAILTSVAKGLENLKIIAVSGVLSSAVIILCNILFLLVFKLGLAGYFYANILGTVVQCLVIVFGIKIWKYRLLFVRHDRTAYKTLEKKIVSYSKPLIANSIGWWVNNVSDRYFVTFFCGLSINGIYSISYKIPTFLNALVSIFNQAWNLSAIKDFDKDDKSGFFSKTYSTYNSIMVILCGVIIVFNRLLALIFYSNEFYFAWKYVPFLLISFYFGAVSGYIGAIFAAIKRTDVYAKSTVTGAIINTVLNALLVFRWGAMGAAIATLISYFCVWVIRYYYMKKYINIRIRIKRDIIAYCLLLIQALFAVILTKDIFLYPIEFIILIIIIVLYIADLKDAINFVLVSIKRKK